MVGQECTGQPCGTADVRAEGSASLPLCPQTLQPSPERLPGGGGPGEPCFSEPGARALRPLPAGTCSLGSRPPHPSLPTAPAPSSPRLGSFQSPHRYTGAPGTCWVQTSGAPPSSQAWVRGRMVARLAGLCTLTGLHMYGRSSDPATIRRRSPPGRHVASVCLAGGECRPAQH